jgi:hypothetical protein
MTTTGERAKLHLSARTDAPGSSDFPKRPILSRPRDSSLCCKPRLKAVVYQFRNRYREFEFSSLHQPVSRLSDIPEN